jgi:hypothetical protein
MLNSLLKHRPGCHPIIKRKYDFSEDKYAWYWIYLKDGSVFNTYDWYVASSGPLYTHWKNFYYADHKGLKIKNKWIKKVVCWKVINKAR